MHHAFKLNGEEHNVELSRSATGYRLHADGRIAHFTMLDLPVRFATHGDDVFVHYEGETYQLTYEHPLDRLAHAAAGAAEDFIRAPMPGSLVVVHAKAGDTVAKGQALLVMESMKMETTLSAARDGVVAEVYFAPGQTFERDALLLSLEPTA
ncbi:MAG TPA: biotin/lipoyl-containing protein [Verrucomicrobiae bacterium]|nr:biotin/lipoyl-containing protein [Verrucomicrobiae bacterium]